MKPRVAPLSTLLCILAASPLGAVGIDAGVQPLQGQSTVNLAVSHIPAAEPLAALQMLVKLRWPRQVSMVVAEAPKLGPWSQIGPDIRQVPGGFSVCALAPSVLTPRDTARTSVMNVQVTVTGTGSADTYNDIIADLRFTTLLDPMGKPLRGIPAEVTHVQHVRPRAEHPLFSERLVGRQYSLTFRLLEDAEVQVALLDLSGRTVARLLDTKLTRGLHTMRCQLSTASSGPLIPGTYLLHARIGSTTISKKVRHIR